ncbi:MAG: hypothetical protein EOP51_06595 [Sphingobacteriales bacterium]|nr:MAG: hypothetical protein EOP51_06595 [Sphingobacteriales bacterium]
MKKKHLHGKLSLKMKDLSAMNGQAKQAQGGFDEPTLACTKDWTNCAQCEDGTMATCAGGNTCDQTCITCGGNSCINQCPDTTPPRGCTTFHTCYTTPDAGCGTGVSECVGCIATHPPQAGC